MDEKIKVLAYLELFAGENMRSISITNGYRPVFKFAGAKTGISGRIDLINMDAFPPGAEGKVQVTFLKGMISDDYFRKGVSFKISEGGRYDLGKGEIMQVME